MLTKITVRNFKRFDNVEIELGNPVVFIGPNNSGKTTALQTLALWHTGLKKWLEKRGTGSAPNKRSGVAVNRNDIFSIPISSAKYLWRDLHVRSGSKNRGKKTQNIRIDILVEGVTNRKEWKCGLEFDYSNEESFYCRPLRQQDKNSKNGMDIPEEVHNLSIAFLPPMSGLSEMEYMKQPGEIQSLLSRGETAEVLRNLCYQLYESSEDHKAWQTVADKIEESFGIHLDNPIFFSESGKLSLFYQESNGIRLDISCAGRGVLQTLLLLTYLSLNEGNILLLDEPDAHLEILRQRETYRMLSEFAKRHGSQIIIASHSEVVLGEAAEQDVVVAFLGSPHRINDRGSQLAKALKEIRFDEYYHALETGWVLYLEGSTDLAILQTFAERLNHQASEYLKRPFVHYIQNNRVEIPRRHFYGLKEAKSDLIGLAIFDRTDSGNLSENEALEIRCWQKREIENYLCTKKTLLLWAESNTGEKNEANSPDLADLARGKKQRKAMEEALEGTIGKTFLDDPKDSWWSDTKVSDDVLPRLFEEYYKKIGIENLMRKKNFHELARYVPDVEISEEIGKMLDAIVAVAKKAEAK